MGIVSTNNGDFVFSTADETIKFVRTAAQDKNDIWISGELPYPCIAFCINGEYAAVKGNNKEKDRACFRRNCPVYGRSACDSNSF